MSKKLYVGNLAQDVNSNDLEQLFAVHGALNSASVISDRTTGQSKGFGFVEFTRQQDAQAAISALNGKEVKGRNLTVNEARPQSDGRRGFGGGGGGGRGGYSGGRR